MTRLLYSNLLKMGFTDFQNIEKRVIDANGMMEQRMERMAVQQAQVKKKSPAGSADGFAAGLSAETIEGLFGGDSEEGAGSNVIKAANNEEYEAAIADANVAAEEILEKARAQAQAESDELIAGAKEQIEKERQETLAKAKEQGYREGAERAKRELESKLDELVKKEKEMEDGFDDLLKQLEPQFVDVITDVYEHLFNVELSGYREILMHLILSAMRKIEGSRSFLIHVSAEDYPYVSMEKKQLAGAITSPNATLELMEDATLSHNQCMIETEAGIFDCGLGTQLAELTQRLKLLSYEKGV
ncbi:MAG: FliH/SctL family protein [Butyrivibrio sp.]|nr:FliH/SctL family protein [Muribaculum sp.]MCM1552699.1 FliH/SctL family protein [Butyrivibrio sp.]